MLHLYFKVPPRTDRFVWGDRYVFSWAKKLLKKNRISGIEKVLHNLRKGLDELNTSYDINLPFEKIKPGEPVVVLGLGRYALQGYALPNSIIAGIGLMTHPSEWPDLCIEFPVVKYLQHSTWTKNIYVPYFGNKCDLWPSGIDTEKWAPAVGATKTFDVLVYNKIMWDKQTCDKQLRLPILQKLHELGLSYHEITYGDYTEAEYSALLSQSVAMIFLCEHESQGFACCEALSMNVPVFAWDQGFWLDPHRFNGDDPVIAATSIPFFDERCGSSFTDFAEFENKIDPFLQNVNERKYSPREYVIENLTLKKSAQRMLEIIQEVYNN
jgi:hypothetical protein